MPGAVGSGFDPEEFAKLMARFDTGNSSEAEAMNAGRLLRRSLASNGLRLVDVMGRADVIQALDAQLQPVREESPELKAAFLEIAKLAELAKEREDLIDELRGELAAGGCVGNYGRASSPALAGAGLVNGGLIAAASITAVVLMLAAAFQSFQ